MKYAVAFLFFLVIVLSVCLFFKVEDGADLEREKKQLNIQLSRIKTARDSIIRYNTKLKDSLEISELLVKASQVDVVRAKAESQKWYKQLIYEQGHIPRFANDTARGRAITELFPSYKHP